MYSTEKGSNAMSNRAGRSKNGADLPLDSDTSDGCSQCFTDPSLSVLVQRISQKAPDEMGGARAVATDATNCRQDWHMAEGSRLAAQSGGAAPTPPSTPAQFLFH